MNPTTKVTSTTEDLPVTQHHKSKSRDSTPRRASAYPNGLEVRINPLPALWQKKTERAKIRDASPARVSSPLSDPEKKTDAIAGSLFKISIKDQPSPPLKPHKGSAILSRAEAVPSPMTRSKSLDPVQSPAEGPQLPMLPLESPSFRGSDSSSSPVSPLTFPSSRSGDTKTGETKTVEKVDIKPSHESCSSAESDSALSDSASSSTSKTRERRKSISGLIYKVSDSIVKRSSSPVVRDSSPSPQRSATVAPKKPKEKKPDTIEQRKVILEPRLLEAAQACERGIDSGLSLEFLQSLQPSSRADLLYWLETSGKANAAVKSVTARIRECQLERMNRALLSAICTPDEDKQVLVSDALCLSCKTVISPSVLFEAIHKAITSEPCPFTFAKLENLLLFCVRWIRENKGTKWRKEAHSQIESIIQAVSTHAEEKLRSFALTLRKYLDEQPALKPFESVFESASFKQKSIFQILDDLCAGRMSAEQVEILVNQVARDLIAYQAQLYLPLKKHDLIDKRDANDLPPALARIISWSNALSNYVSEAVFERESLDDRIHILRFFIKVMELAYKDRDYATVQAIYAAFDLGPVLRLKTTWKRLGNDETIKAKFQEFEKLLAPINNFKVLRKKIQEDRSRSGPEDKKMYLPFLGMVRRDITYYAEGQKKIIIDKTDSEPKYNMEGLIQVRKRVLEELDHQSKWHQIIAGVTPHTDIVYVCREWAPKTSKEVDDTQEAKYGMAQRFERVENNLRDPDVFFKNT